MDKEVYEIARTLQERPEILKLKIAFSELSEKNQKFVYETIKHGGINALLRVRPISAR